MVGWDGEGGGFDYDIVRLCLDARARGRFMVRTSGVGV